MAVCANCSRPAAGVEILHLLRHSDGRRRFVDRSRSRRARQPRAACRGHPGRRAGTDSCGDPPRRERPAPRQHSRRARPDPRLPGQPARRPLRASGAQPDQPHGRTRHGDRLGRDRARLPLASGSARARHQLPRSQRLNPGAVSTTTLPLRWGTARARTVGGGILIVSGAVAIAGWDDFVPPLLLAGLLAHVAGWSAMPADGWRRVVAVIISTPAALALLTGPRFLGVLVLPYIAWLLVR